jgi:hypothetical protein
MFMGVWEWDTSGPGKESGTASVQCTQLAYVGCYLFHTQHHHHYIVGPNIIIITTLLVIRAYNVFYGRLISVC